MEHINYSAQPDIIEIGDSSVIEIENTKVDQKLKIKRAPISFSKQKYQQILNLIPSNAYMMKHSEKAELMLSKLLFESIEQAKQQIKEKTTLRCIQNANSYTCVFYQRKYSMLQSFNIGEVGKTDFSDIEIQNKISLLKNDVKRRSTIKNSCRRSCGVSSLQGMTIKDNFKRYSQQYDYLVNQDLQVVELEQYSFKKNYYQINFYNSHDYGNLSCKFTTIQTKSHFTTQQMDMITNFAQDHNYEDFEAFWTMNCKYFKQTKKQVCTKVHSYFKARDEDIQIKQLCQDNDFHYIW
ncbi:Hypothetical_protein [Hexamita inflata]|uniref:Hypothetical_protein n=1 Tax=Hexamita inflata TaxID=28002 RepID=A0AA86TS06_9EUKA|nr:Hypothetical protein HINF_LOCUS12152 [Hexamita inflata]